MCNVLCGHSIQVFQYDGSISCFTPFLGFFFFFGLVTVVLFVIPLPGFLMFICVKRPPVSLALYNITIYYWWCLIPFPPSPSPLSSLPSLSPSLPFLLPPLPFPLILFLFHFFSFSFHLPPLSPLSPFSSPPHSTHAIITEIQALRRCAHYWSQGQAQLVWGMGYC